MLNSLRRFTRRRDGRVVEGARLESVFRGNSNVGSNPTLSASPTLSPYKSIDYKLIIIIISHLHASL